jgi:hypothetical protein
VKIAAAGLLILCCYSVADADPNTIAPRKVVLALGLEFARPVIAVEVGSCFDFSSDWQQSRVEFSGCILSEDEGGITFTARIKIHSDRLDAVHEDTMTYQRGSTLVFPDLGGASLAIQ